MFAILAAEGPADEVSANGSRDEQAATIDTEYQVTLAQTLTACS